MEKEYQTASLNELSSQLAEFQVRMGFTDSSITQRLMLVHSEVSEAFEAFRRDRYARVKNYIEGYDHQDNLEQKKAGFELHIKDSFEDEIADSIIRLLALCGENNIDIEKHIQLKMRYNEMRGFKYGGKKF